MGLFPALGAVAATWLGLGLAGCAPGGEPHPPTGDREAALAELQTARQHARREELELATEAGRRAVAADPGLAEAHWVLGKVLLYSSDVVVGTPTRDDTLLREAAAQLERATELEPENIEYAYWTGRAFALLRQPLVAVEYLSSVVARDPTHGAAYKELALVYRDTGDVALAGANFELAVEHLPDSADLWFQYGMHLEVEEDLDGARAAYERSRELDWTVPRTYSRLAVLLRRVGDPEGAEEAEREFEKWREFGTRLNELLTLANAKRSELVNLMAVGELYMSARRYATAEAWFQRACALAPGDAEAQRALEAARAKHPSERAE